MVELVEFVEGLEDGGETSVIRGAVEELIGAVEAG